MTPVMVKNTSNYLIDLYSRSQNAAIAAPVIIKGVEGTGKSWIITQVFDAIDANPDSAILPVRVPMQLNGERLVHNIVQEIAYRKFQALKRTSHFPGKEEKKILLFIENIDRLFNLPGRERTFIPPARSKGAGAAIFTQLQHASEFRSFLIENGRTIGVIATAGEDTAFIEDPEQPFFQFFNVLELRQLPDLDANLYLRGKLPQNTFQTQIVELLKQFSDSWVSSLSDGKVSYLNLLAATLGEVPERGAGSTMPIEKLIENFLDLYFYKVVPHIELQLEKLSYQEKYAIDQIVLLPDYFYSKDLDNVSSNSSALMASLKLKGLIEVTGDAHAARYRLRSSCLKAYLRFHKMAHITQVLNSSGQMSKVGL